jgi:hypothetical protein
MKKSTKVTLTVVAAMGLASCGRSRLDPCEQGSFNEMACQDAVRSGGYYPYPYYYDHYRTHVSSGGRVMSAPSGSYARPGGTTSSPGVTRGGFGSIGAGHSAGA